jgi:predicted site-specific integrase-resolvase
MIKSLSIGQSASFLSVSFVTLRRWDRLGKLNSFRTFGNHRRFFFDDLLKLHNSNKLHVDYARVSSHDQKKDLETQIKCLDKYIQNDNKIIISDLGSGLNFNKKGLIHLISLIISRKIHTLYLTHKERLLRFGSELIFKLCSTFGTNVVIINSSESKSFEVTLAEDVIELMTVFSAKLYGKRSHHNKKSINT